MDQIGKPPRSDAMAVFSAQRADQSCSRRSFWGRIAVTRMMAVLEIDALRSRVLIFRLLPQGVRMIMVAPALSRPQHSGAQERPHVMHDLSLSLQIVQPLLHPGRDAAAFKDLAPKHGAVCTGQSVQSAFDLQGPVELRRDWL